MKKLESEKKKVESDYNATNSRIQVDFDGHDGWRNYENIDDFFKCAKMMLTVACYFKVTIVGLLSEQKVDKRKYHLD